MQLGDGVQQSAELESLNLSGNSIVCKGALALSQELLQNVPLRSLNLANNSLADRAGVAVAGLLLPSSACNFSCLQMSGNCSLGSSTAAKLAQVLPYTTSLKTLDLSRTQLSAHICLFCWNKQYENSAYMHTKRHRAFFSSESVTRCYGQGPVNAPRALSQQCRGVQMARHCHSWQGRCRRTRPLYLSTLAAVESGSGRSETCLQLWIPTRVCRIFASARTV